MILAAQEDHSAICAFLRRHLATSMFPLSNLLRYGMSGDHPHTMKVWLRRHAGEIVDLLALSRAGVVFPQCPNSSWDDMKSTLSERKITGILGDDAQVADLRRVLNLPDGPVLDTREPLYHLPLGQLDVPEHDEFSLHALEVAPRELVVGWRQDFINEAIPRPDLDAEQRARDDIASYIERDSHRVLYLRGKPVAMTGFNATIPEAVQIGGVYTPPAFRSRGFARRAVALHLQQAREKSVGHAILMAASNQAAKAYEAIGFSQVGHFRMSFYARPQVVHD